MVPSAPSAFFTALLPDSSHAAESRGDSSGERFPPEMLRPQFPDALPGVSLGGCL